MQNEMELCQVIYSFLTTQIRFGAYRFGDRLPTMEETSQQMLVSFDTVRSAYRRLQADGFITLSKSIGTTVRVHYSKAEIERNIQAFYGERKDALLDLSQSMRLLFGKTQWLALKTMPPESLNKIESYAREKDIFPSYARQLQLIYDSLHNELMMRLVWQSFMFFEAPFLSIAGNIKYFVKAGNPLLNMTGYCRKKDWAGLQTAVDNFLMVFPSALSQFYAERLVPSPAQPQIAFAWSSYKKPSQLCYSLSQEILGSISRGEFPAGSYLPSLEKLAKEKQVSVSTIRRTLTILNQIGAIRSINGVGAQVLLLDQSSENCDFTQPIVRKRLLDYIQSLQILTLTCRRAAESTFVSPDSLAQWKNLLHEIRRTGRYETIIYDSMKFISRHAPLQTIRMVYAQLLQLLFWGHPLRGINGNQKDFNRLLLPHLEILFSCLERGDSAAFAAELEDISIRQLNFTAELMTRLGFAQADTLRVPTNL